MVDYNLIIICFTIVVIGVPFLLVISKSKSFELKGDLHKKNLSLKTSESVRFDDINNIQIPKAIKNLNPYDGNNILNHYKGFVPSDEISRLEVYKEFTRIIREQNLFILCEIVLFLSKNNITSLKESQYNKYVEEKILYFCSMYDESFNKSCNSFINSMTIKNVLGVYYYIFVDILRNFYKTVLAEHKNGELDRNNYFKHIVELRNTNHSVSVKEIINTLYIMFCDSNYTDAKFLVKTVLEYNNLLVGIFHDKLKQAIKEYYNKD